MRKSLFAFLLLALTVPAVAAPLDNWPHWRGPLVNGSAPRGNPPLKWDEKTNIKWKVALPGRGASTPIVWGDQVFVMTAIDTGKEANPKDIPKFVRRTNVKTTAPTTYHQFVVLALDRTTGKERWRRVAATRVPHEGHHFTHSYAAGSPTTDGKRLYVSFGSFGLYCYDLAGKLLWERDFGRFETRLGWGEASTPVIHGDTLILNCDQESRSFIVALDAAKGTTKWKKDRDEVTTWATPLIVEHKGKAQVIVMATKKVRSYDLATGKVLWECGGQTVNCIPSPVQHDNFVVCLSGYGRAAALAIRLDASGDVTDSRDKVLWRADKGTPYVPSPLLMGGKLYFTRGNDPFYTCLDVCTGRALLSQGRLPQLRNLYASPVGAAGRIYIVDRQGTTVVLEEGPKAKVLAVNRLEDTIDASPAIVGKQLFLRGEKHLYCIEEK
jgi:outer membrane protein assembly factor BamB